MDMQGVEPEVGVRTWAEALSIISTMNAVEALCAINAFASYMAHCEALGGTRPNDEIYAIRAAFNAATELSVIPRTLLDAYHASLSRVTPTLPLANGEY